VVEATARDAGLIDGGITRNDEDVNTASALRAAR
jgi:hypothetical protein